MPERHFINHLPAKKRSSGPKRGSGWQEITKWIHGRLVLMTPTALGPALPTSELPCQPEIAESAPSEESGPYLSLGQLKSSTPLCPRSYLPTSAPHLLLQFFLPAASNCPFRVPNVSSEAFNLSWELPGSLPLISIPVSVRSALNLLLQNLPQLFPHLLS